MSVSVKSKSVRMLFEYIYCVILGPAVIRGMKATTKLLRKAKQIPSGTKHMSAGDVTVEFRQFVKPGNYDTAMKDFFSVKPTGVQEFELPKQVQTYFFIQQVQVNNY